MKIKKFSKTLRRIVSLSLALVFAATFKPFVRSVAAAAWDGKAAHGFHSGNGTRNDPFLIATPDQLALFRDRVNSGHTGICAKVIDDIDLGGMPWTPIGLSQEGYTGIFEGGGRAIKNLHLNSVSNGITVRIHSGALVRITVTGLFGVIGDKGVVKYVDISGSIKGSFNGTSISSLVDTSRSASIYIGTLAGCNYGTVEECYSTCSITGLSVTNGGYIGIGGLVGFNESGSVIRNSFNVGAIDATLRTNIQSHDNYIGGIAGYHRGEMYNCYSAAPIKITTNSTHLYLGGVIGASIEDGVARNCYFDRNVCASASYVAGRSFSSSKAYNPAGSSPKNTSDMKTIAFASALGNSFAYDAAEVNNGYPILAVMTYGQQAAYSPWAEKELTDPDNQAIYKRLFPDELYNKDLKKPITRTEFAAVAVKLYEEMGGKVLDASGLKNPFFDTSNSAVIKAVSIGVVAGISPTEFLPYAPISRQDMCAMLTRVYKSLNLPGWTLAADNSFKLDYSGVRRFADDSKISDYAKPSVYFLVKNNVIAGLTSSEFGPRSTTTAEQAIGYANASREQAAIVAIRMFKYING